MKPTTKKKSVNPQVDYLNEFVKKNNINIKGKVRKNGEVPKTFDPAKLLNIIPTYTVSLKYGDKIYTQSSDDITEAILALKPEKINNRTVFTLEYNGKKSEVMKSVPRAKRILTNRLAAQLFGKYLFMRLK